MARNLTGYGTRCDETTGPPSAPPRQRARHLAAWLLAGNGDWSDDRVEEMKQSGKRLDVRLKKPVPLHFVYVTAWATSDGVVQFRRDLYQRDGIGAVAANY